MKQSKETTPLWVWLTFGLISLGIAAYAAVQDDIVAIPGQLRRQREQSF
jgi:hypothetical protein